MTNRDNILLEYMHGRPTQGTPELTIIICNMADEIVKLRNELYTIHNRDK